MADLATNRKAFHNYHVTDKLEVGIVLTGTEVKSCRARNVSLAEAYARLADGELFLHSAHIAPYDEGNRMNHEPRRMRKLLAHRAEIRKLAAASQEKGLALIPLAMYLKRGRVKVSIGICRGKTKGDKRQALKAKQADLDMRKALRRHRT